jgi:TolB-like protein
VTLTQSSKSGAVPWRRPGLAAFLVLLAACASNPASRRATVISDADKAAKAALASENSLDPSKIPARTFAVLPFSVEMKDTLIVPLSFGLADLLINDLSKTPELRLVERMHTNAIMRELNMVDEGITDPRQGPRVGRLVGARRLLLGSATMVGGTTMRLDARVVDVIAGTVQDVLSATAPLERVIDAEKQLALLIIERLGITLTPAQRTRIEQRQTSQLTALVAYGRGVEAETRGDALAATAAFEEASRLDVAFSVARGQLAGSAPSSSRAANSVQRVIELTTTSVNAPVTTRIPEAVDAPLARGSVLDLIFTVRVTP